MTQNPFDDPRIHELEREVQHWKELAESQIAVMSSDVVEFRYRVVLELPLTSLMKKCGFSDAEYYTNDLNHACKLLNVNDGRGQLFANGERLA